MRNQTAAFDLWCALLALVIPASVAGQTRAPDTWADRILSVRSALGGDVPQWSPDGKLIMFPSSIGESAGLAAISPNGGTPAKLTDGLGGVPFQLAQQPRWSPTGEFISYVSDKEVDGNGADIWLWSVREARHVRLTFHGARIGSTSWSPDGKSIAFSGGLNGNYDIFTVSVPDGVVRQLTSDIRYETTPAWTPDSRTLVFVRTDDHWVDHDIMKIAATGGQPALVTADRDFFDYNTTGTPAFGTPVLSPDGGTVIFRSWRTGWVNYWAVPINGGTPVALAPESADQSGAVWSPDGRTVAFGSNHNGTHDLRVVPVQNAGASVRFGPARVLVSPALGVASNFAWSPDGTRISYTLASPMHPADLYIVSPGSGSTTQLTSTQMAAGVAGELVTPEKVTYKSDTLTITAYLYKPRNASPGQKFPAIVFGHGGPTSQYADTYDQQMQYFAGLGYVVLAPNFRGSSGYGRAFADANNKCWAHCDLADLVAGVEYLKKQPYINGKFGITGTSHGGLLAMAGATFAPGVFQAAIAHGGTADRIYYYNTQELRHIKQAENEFGPLKGNEETYRYVSPFYFAKEVNTPIFVIWGEGRWPGSNNSKNYVAELDRLYKTYRAKAYQGENYYVSGRANVRQMLIDMTAYFDQYLRQARTVSSTSANASMQP